MQIASNMKNILTKFQFHPLMHLEGFSTTLKHSQLASPLAFCILADFQIFAIFAQMTRAFRSQPVLLFTIAENPGISSTLGSAVFAMLVMLPRSNGPRRTWTSPICTAYLFSNCRSRLRLDPNLSRTSHARMLIKHAKATHPFVRQYP